MNHANAPAAVKFFDEVARLAEQEGHHPDLHLTHYREVTVTMPSMFMLDMHTGRHLHANAGFAGAGINPCNQGFVNV